MVDFSNVAKLAVTAADVKEYPLIELAGAPVLFLRCANEGNSGYMNGVLRLTGQDGKTRKKAMVMDVQAMEDLREHDKELYPAHVITGWRSVLESDGNDVPFTQENCTAFLAALPAWIFDGVRGYAMKPENFVPQIDSEAKGKN